MPPTTAHQTDRIVTHNKSFCYFKAIYSFLTSRFLTTFHQPIRSSTRAYINHIVNDPGVNKESLSNEVVSLSRILKANEMQAMQMMPRNFVEELDHKLCQTHAYSFNGAPSNSCILV
jgi:hypothetical protein